AVDPILVSLSDLHAQTLSLKKTRVFSPSLVNVATVGYAGTWGTLVNQPAIPMPADIVFLEGGNPGTLVIGGGIGAAAPSAIAGPPGSNHPRVRRRYYTAIEAVAPAH